jgi:hypothetical protein
MFSNRLWGWVCFLSVTTTVAISTIGCAHTSSERALINSAKHYAKTQGIEVEKYSAAVVDKGEDFFILFTRRSWPHTVGNHFGVFKNKQTGEYRLSYGR